MWLFKVDILAACIQDYNEIECNGTVTLWQRGLPVRTLPFCSQAIDDSISLHFSVTKSADNKYYTLSGSPNFFFLLQYFRPSYVACLEELELWLFFFSTAVVFNVSPFILPQRQWYSTAVFIIVTFSV